MNVNYLSVGASWGSSLMSGIEAYWKFDETSGTDLDDSVGTRNCTANATATATASGKINYGRDFNGSTSRIRVPIAASTNLVDKFTLSMWVKFDTLPSVLTHSSYLHASYIIDSGGVYSIRMYVLTDDCIYFSPYSGCYVATNAITDTTNYMHIVGVINGIGGSIKIYINGTDVTTTNDTLDSAFFPTGTAADSIGNTYEGGTAVLDGRIDEVAIWSRNLSPAEITQLYAAGAGLVYPFS